MSSGRERSRFPVTTSSFTLDSAHSLEGHTSFQIRVTGKSGNRWTRVVGERGTTPRQKIEKGGSHSDLVSSTMVQYKECRGWLR